MIYRLLKKLAPFLPFLLLLWMGLALYLTLFPGDLLTSAARLGNPKVGHVILFGGWTLLFGLTVMIYFGRSTVSIFLIVLAGILFGAVVEVMQFMMPFDRQGSVTDVGLNTIGAVIAGLMLLLFKARYMNAQKPSGKRNAEK
ncbi:MAG: VanZ family protein [Balneolia bacterium]|nr:VanZ family protein [Balneolia bacterium]